MKKRSLCILLCLALLAALPPITAAAEDWAFDAQLSGYAEIVYDALYRSPDTMRSLYTGESFDLSFEGPFLDVDAAGSELAEAFTPAFAALQANHPELFWLNGFRVSISGSKSRLLMTVYPAFASNWAAGGRSVFADAEAVDAAARAVAAEAAAQGEPYAQLLYVHDWLTEHNVYNLDAAQYSGPSAGRDFLPWSPLSALTDESQPVCEGYARAFKLICDKLEIPCLFVVGNFRGENHAWNMVRLDGSWYAVDVTLDDPVVQGVNSPVSGMEHHDYFLAGANTPANGAAFSSSHTQSGEYMEGVRFRYPALSQEAYQPSGSDPASEAPEKPDHPAQPVPALPFLDVPAGAGYFDAVRWAYTSVPQVTTGVDETHFGPDDTVTRGQAVTFLWRALGCPEPRSAQNAFEDVAASDYYYPAVLWAVEKGIARGTDETHFSPAQTCSEAHIITFLYRAMGAGADGWYAQARDWAAQAGLLEGVDRDISPDTACPRADIVLFLYREAAAHK